MIIIIFHCMYFKLFLIEYVQGKAIKDMNDRYSY